jgi:hypothetical protein
MARDWKEIHTSVITGPKGCTEAEMEALIDRRAMKSTIIVDAKSDGGSLTPTVVIQRAEGVSQTPGRAVIGHHDQV